MHITNYTPRFRRTNSIGRRQQLTPDEVLRLPPDEELVFIRGQKVFRAKRFDYSLHSEYRKLKSSKAILHEPDWKTSRAFLHQEPVNSAVPDASEPVPDRTPSGGKAKPTPAKPGQILGRKSDLSEIL